MNSGKRGAMEMSVGTIVTIVLLMGVLVLGIFLIQKIFKSGSNAIDSIDSEVQSQIQKLFTSDDNKKTAFYPVSQRLTFKQGQKDSGFAFAIRNLDSTTEPFSFKITATDVSNCPGITEDQATGYLLGGNGGPINLASGATINRLVTFVLPETVPLCTMEYQLDITRNSNEPYDNLNFFVTVQ